MPHFVSLQTSAVGSFKIALVTREKLFSIMFYHMLGQIFLTSILEITEWTLWQVGRMLQSPNFCSSISLPVTTF